MTKQEFIDAVSSPKAQGVIRAVLAGSGFIGVKLLKWGFPSADLPVLADMAVYFIPMIAAAAWSIYDKLEARVVERAGEILAKREAGAIVLTAAAPPKLAKLAYDDAQTNVLAASSSEAATIASAPPPTDTGPKS